MTTASPTMRGGISLVAKQGNTVRFQGFTGPRFVLVVGDDRLSRWWFHAIRRYPLPLLCHFLVDQDFVFLGPHLRIPTSPLPLILVTVHGWCVDAFPAPKPPSWDPPASAATLEGILTPHLEPYIHG